MCQSLVATVHRCLGAPSLETLSFALEAVLTLQHVVATLAPPKLVLFPQLFWAAIVLLHVQVRPVAF